MLNALLTRRAFTFALGALLGALATHAVLLVIGGGQFQALLPSYNLATTVATESSIATTSATVAKTTQTPKKLPKAADAIRKVRLLCLIITHAGNYRTKATAVNNTWAGRCDKYVFAASNATDLNLPLMRLSIADTYNNLWQKTWMSFDSAEKHFTLDDYDFVLKADDDTYVIVENLKLLLAQFDPNQPIHLGRWFVYNGDAKHQSYMSGGAGYILSRAAVKLFLERAVRATNTTKECNLQEHTAEDWMMGTCLTSLGVKLVDSRDSFGLDRFHPINVEYMIGWGPAEMPPWMWKINHYKFKACVHRCISSVTATFHYTDNMYVTDFLLYGMRPVGVRPSRDTLRAELIRLKNR